MARCTGKMLDFVCLTCGAEQTKFCWMYHRAEDQDKNTPYPSECGNDECPDPHITYKPRHLSLQQVRESQRAVVYMLPDGDYMAPGTNDPNDPMAKTARESGGVRMEFHSVREMQDFHRRRAESKREEWQRMADEGKWDINTPGFKELQDAAYTVSRNNVIDYDERSLRESRDYIREQMVERAEQHRESVERFRRLRVGRADDARRYEELRRRGR